MGVMWKSLIAVTFMGVIAMTTTMSNAQEPEIPEGFSLSPMMRASIIVRDLDASLQLYRDILGLRPRVERALDGEAVNLIMGTEGKSLRVAILQSGDLVFANLGLFEYVGNGEPPPEAVSEVRTGDVALVFLTNDIYRIFDAVAAAGYTIVSQPTVLFPQEDSPTQSLEMIFFDGDGIAINLIERDVPNEDIR